MIIVFLSVSFLLSIMIFILYINILKFVNPFTFR